MITHAASRKQYTVLLDCPRSCSFFVSRLTFEERFPKMIVLIFSAAFFNPIRAEFEKGGNDFA